MVGVKHKWHSLIEAFEYILDVRLRSVIRPVSRATPMLLMNVNLAHALASFR